MLKKGQTENIQLIVNNDLCVSCGACVHVCPFSNIYMKYSCFRGKWDAEIKDGLICQNCDGVENCLYVCPSYNVNYIKLAGSDRNNLLGTVKAIYSGYSRDQPIRYNASSGGGIREICKVLLKEKLIDGVISIVHQKGLEYVPKIQEDVSDFSTSIYHNINFEETLRLLKDKKNTGKYLVVGLPCQLTSIELFLSKNRFSSLKEKIYAKVGLMCGFSFDRHNLEALSYYSKFNIQQVVYRGSGRFRVTKVSDGKNVLEFSLSEPKTIDEDVSHALFFDNFLSQTGCLYCVDHMAYCADLVFGDAWLKKYKDDNVGINIIIARTQKGMNMIKKMKNFFFEDSSYRDIIESQSEDYALGVIGESMKFVKRKGMFFRPEHIRSRDTKVIKKRKFFLAEIVKIKIIKRLFREKYFLLARIIFIVLDLKKIAERAFKGRTREA